MTKKEGGIFVGLLGLAGLAWLVGSSRKASATPAPAPPLPPGPDVRPAPPAPPPPAPPPAPGSLAAQIRQQAAAFEIPPWLALATAQVESSMQVLPSKDEGGQYGRTHYPMGIKAATVATALGHADQWWTDPARWEAVSDDLPVQIDAACSLLARYYRDAQAALQRLGAVPPGFDLDLVRIGWQGGWGAAESAINNRRLPDWYTAVQARSNTSFRQRWFRAIAQWGGPAYQV